ncbi:hypothetical protein TRP8649_01778 [Pelagimonas phthalicica]|uniref:Uncharacterized protein n=1 Tax=Pelagimonas phthalicica TaxID=1037362 RepID=A0A238JAD5_9RHOB|nr:hypothetical protein [Pelagimonas phthalicica]TDS93806.1 hypothetical protein CLV87_0295 [Pelagimonas phthalicica]SMX27670.1 hypothetical protein TRP8649_01778 [Pelagimonas phthalicica]
MDAKIATCCYCGTRAALVLDKARHELVCSSCGAPLHDLKRIKSSVAGVAHIDGAGPARPIGKKSKGKDHRKPPKGSYVEKRKKQKKRKGFGAKLFDEAFDFIEDIFD